MHSVMAQSDTLATGGKPGAQLCFDGKRTLLALLGRTISATAPNPLVSSRPASLCITCGDTSYMGQSPEVSRPGRALLSALNTATTCMRDKRWLVHGQPYCGVNLSLPGRAHMPQLGASAARATDECGERVQQRCTRYTPPIDLRMPVVAR